MYILWLISGRNISYSFSKLNSSVIIRFFEKRENSLIYFNIIIDEAVVHKFWAYGKNMGVHKGGGQGGSCPSSFWILDQGVSRRALFFPTATSCSDYSCQLQSKRTVLLPLQLEISKFSLARARTLTKNRFCGRRAQKMVDFCLLFIAPTCVMHSCML